MRTNRIARDLYWLCAIFLVGFGRMAAEPPAHCAQDLFCLFNQKASASSPAAIQKYSHALVKLIAPPETGMTYVDSLATRLASAEQAARAGKGKLVPETNILRAFNELMNEIGAPSSLKSDEATVQRFREHATSIKAFPALLTSGRNGRDCNPGEAVFLFYLLLSGNGNLFEQDLDRSQRLAEINSQDREPGFLIGGMEPVGSRADRLLSAYISRRGQNTAMVIFNKLATTLGF